jgi:hypothetical protein
VKTLTRNTLTEQAVNPVAMGRSEVNYSPRTLGRIAGLLYLMLAVTAFFGVYVQSRIVESGDAGATADNIRNSTTLYRFGFASDLVQHAFFLFTAMAFYLLLRHVHRLVAGAMVIIVTVSVAIQSLNMLNQYTAIEIATSKSYTQSFGEPGSDALAMLFTDMQKNGVLVAQLFFALWLVPLGYLVLKSGYFPKIFGVFLVIGCFVYLVELFLHFLAPGLADDTVTITALLETVSEMPFLIWLLVKGVQEPAPSEHFRTNQ